MKRSEISEEIRYVYRCPKCGEINEEWEYEEDDEKLVCEHCLEEIMLE